MSGARSGRALPRAGPSCKQVSSPGRRAERCQPRAGPGRAAWGRSYLEAPERESGDDRWFLGEGAGPRGMEGGWRRRLRERLRRRAAAGRPGDGRQPQATAAPCGVSPARLGGCGGGRGGGGASRPHSGTQGLRLQQRRRQLHDPPPRARPIKSASNPLRPRRFLTHIPGGRRLCSLPRTRRRRQRRRGEGGKGREGSWIRRSSKREEEGRGGGAADAGAAAAGAADRYPR
ncbi:uncharacterized protein [Notamacropus eugenii]|uniref:uncharacterized protein isoform X1 n=1 Tax=Notamacropus eugenii TaxID=9315 RepID=UPI003B6822DE